MNSLKWQPTGQNTNSSPSVASAQARTGTGGSNPLVVSSPNPWFAVSMGLVGLIAGYTIANSNLVPGSSSRLPSFAQAPSAPIQPPSQGQPPPPPPAVSFENIPAVDLVKDHIRGNPKAEVAIVQYSDFECPFSKRVQATYKQIADTYGDKVMVVFRQFPLGFHQNAEPAAIASECAAELGGSGVFWKFLDKVYEKQGEWKYEDYAKEFGLDAQKFKDCIGNGKYKQLVQDQLGGGSKAGVNGTPANFILNLKKKTVAEVGGAQPFENFKSAIDAALKG